MYANFYVEIPSGEFMSSDSDFMFSWIHVEEEVIFIPHILIVYISKADSFHELATVSL